MINFDQNFNKGSLHENHADVWNDHMEEPIESISDDEIVSEQENLAKEHALLDQNINNLIETSKLSVNTLKHLKRKIELSGKKDFNSKLEITKIEKEIERFEQVISKLMKIKKDNNLL